ncbi:MAG: radical SAM protein, partial [Candidatus Lokiarchaeota archaeon]|nr:radical SAM protein [Candidatus Lokiarchaeota archaeon]
FKLIKDTHPEINLCLATNGLELPNHIDELAEYDVSNITITINFIDPRKFSQIYEYILYNGKKYTGEEAGKIIKLNQLNGIELAKEKGILTRVNTVFISGINNDQIEDISRETYERGAVLHNIMPLIPIYQFKDHRRPNKNELHEARVISGNYLPQFRLCKQCRADAVGIPGIERTKTCKDEECTFIRFHG